MVEQLMVVGKQPVLIVGIVVIHFRLRFIG
jgi:hypothetical protein